MVMGFCGGPASKSARGELGLGDLMLEVRRAFDVNDFIETGTFEGVTAAWAAQHFRRVVTMEASVDLHRAAAERHRALANVRFVHGNTREVLPGVIAELTGPAVFWLDAHYSAGVTYGVHDECPVVEEIAAARGAKHDCFLFIDDARLFLAPPPRPHQRAHWPSLARLVQALVEGERALEPFVYADTVIAVPERARERIADLLQQEATRALAAEDARRHSAWGGLRRSILRALR